MPAPTFFKINPASTYLADVDGGQNGAGHGWGGSIQANVGGRTAPRQGRKAMKGLIPAWVCWSFWHHPCVL